MTRLRMPLDNQLSRPPVDYALKTEIMLYEYQTSKNKEERDALYHSKEDFRPYWDSESWLLLHFERGEPCVRASHYVGLLPFQRGEQAHLLFVAPKGCDAETPENPVGLLRFLEMVAIANGGEASEEDIKGVGMEGGRLERFLALLAAHYGSLLRKLCRRDFRLYFRPEEDELRGRVRGRVRPSAHLRNCLRGRAHVLPCSWEEFTPDNWDNRVLLGAMRLVERAVVALAPKAVDFVRDRFLGLDQWFSAVEEVAIRGSDFGKTRLWRTSRHYKQALDWARLIVLGLDRPTAGGQAPPIVLDANKAFEDFARVVTKTAAEMAGRYDWDVPPNKESIRCLVQPQYQAREPDLMIRGRAAVVAVGDAKYKLVLEQELSTQQLGDLAKEIIPTICSDVCARDWDQLYVYMRMADAKDGFFVVPFWNPDENADAAALIPDFEFAVPPLDRLDGRRARIAVLGLNLLQPLAQVREKAAKRLADWITQT